MTIEHQIVTDADGNPTAALIPWDQFRILKAEMEFDKDVPLSPAWKAEIDRRNQEIEDGTAVGIPHDVVMANMREKLANLRKAAE